MSRQIWTILLVQNWFQFFGCKTQSIQENWQQRFPTGTKSHCGGSIFQPVLAIEEAAGHCSSKLWWRGKFFPSADTNNAQGHGWTTQTGSQDGWRSGRIKQKDFCDSAAVKCGQAREFIYSSPNNCKEEGGRELSTNCLCEIQTWRSYLFTWWNGFCIWLRFL